MKTLLLATAAVALSLSACSGVRYEPCPFAGISSVDAAECKATQNIPNIKKGAKPVKNMSMTTPSGTYKTCPFAGISDVSVRDCKAISSVNNIAKSEKPALKKKK